MLTLEQRTEAEQIRAAALRLRARARAALPTASPALQKRLNEDLMELDNLVLLNDAILASDALPPQLGAEQRQRLTQMISGAKETAAEWTADLDAAKRAGATDKAETLQANLATMNAFVAFLGELDQLQEHMPLELSAPLIKSGFNASEPLRLFGGIKRWQ